MRTLCFRISSRVDSFGRPYFQKFHHFFLVESFIFFLPGGVLGAQALVFYFELF
jgi:hypothetical protein